MSAALPGAGGDHDALLVVSFGGPEGPDDVMPFLDNVLRGRDVPDERKHEVAEQYQRFGGVSPLNGHNRRLVELLDAELDVPVYWGNRNWAPYLADAVAAMAADGVRRAAAFVTSAYGGFSACRQYRDDIAAARTAVGAGAPEIDKLRLYFDHPGFIEPLAEHLRAARAEAGDDAPVLFSAHSIPASMAAGSYYEAQLRCVARLVAARAGDPSWKLVWQSRSGPPQVPWLEPDVRDAIAELAGAGHSAVVVAPIGFTADHQEVVFDLDTQAADAAAAAGLRMVRARTPGHHPRFVRMVGELLAERRGGPVLQLSEFPPGPPTCGLDGCCPPPAPRRRPTTG
ncbi:MAG TPA: ferrochelatase [Acidimicrobiales bacterium]|nr:ferrochelatase [Acidimicrobiales bacterium]